METALVYASANGEIDKVTILLAMGARVDARDQGFTPLMVAAQKGHTEVCELLLANGSDLEERDPVTLMTGVSYLYFMKNTGNITSTQNIEFNVKS